MYMSRWKEVTGSEMHLHIGMHFHKDRPTRLMVDFNISTHTT